MFYKTEDLLDSIKTRTLAPISQSTFQDSDLIKLANEEMQISLVPDIQACREDYFLRNKTTPLVALVNHYRMPERSIGNDLKEIFYLDAQSNKRLMSRTKLHDIPGVASAGTYPSRFYLRADEVIVLPIPSTSQGSLDFWYYNRPNRLVATTSVTKILAVSTGATQTTLTVDTDITAQVSAGSLVDFTTITSPFGNRAEDAVLQSISGTQIVVNNADIQDESGATQPQAGDYICPAQTCNIPQLPQEFHPILAQMVAARVMEALGDVQKLQAVNSKLSEMRKQALQLISNRVESEVEHVINRSGILANVGYWNRQAFLK